MCLAFSACAFSRAAVQESEHRRRSSRGGVGVDDFAALTTRDCTCELVQKSRDFGRIADPNFRDLDLIRRLAVDKAGVSGVAGLDEDNGVKCP